MSAIIVSAFPGMGKTYAFNMLSQEGKVKVKDSDSSHFDKAYFPDNYIDDIRQNIPSYDIIFVSSHKEVRDALEKNKIDFDLFYPSKERRNEFLENYVRRKSKPDLIKKIDNNWNSWIDEINNETNPHCHKHCLSDQGQFIGNNPMIMTFINQVKKNKENKELKEEAK